MMGREGGSAASSGPRIDVAAAQGTVLGMIAFIGRRLLECTLVLLVVSYVIFALIDLMPGDPIDLMVQADPSLTAADAQRLIDEAARGELEVVIDREFPLSEAAAAHAYIESRQAVGRVLLIP